MKKYLLIIASLCYASYMLSYESSLEDTVEYEESYFGDTEASEIQKSMSFSIVKTDLNDYSTARYQIDANLKLISIFANYDIQIWKLPILCIGTGHIKINTILSRFQQNNIHEIDYCLDIQDKLKPDLVCDCFCFKNSNKITKNSFGSIFFAHVGAYGMPLNADMLISLQEYHDLLVPDGFLIYNSEVILKTDLYKLHNFYKISCFEELEKRWRKQLELINFKNIIIHQKNEAQYFSEACMSILIIAQK